MRKLLSPHTHGLVDYVSVAKLLVLPRVLGFSKPMVRALDCMALAKLALNLLSGHRYAAAPVVPMKMHLAVDAVNGAAMVALPFMLGEDDPAAVATCAAAGGMDIIMAAVTETEAQEAEQWKVAHPRGRVRRMETAMSAR